MGQLRHDSHQSTMGRYYPLKAQQALVEGSAQVRCYVDDEGWGWGCRVLSERPKGYQFGDYAVGLAGLMHFQSKKTGTAITAATVTFPIDFKLYGPG